MPAIVDLLKQYLLQKRSVTLKNLGQFSLEQISASVHPVIHEFRPPSVVIFFEEQKNCDTEDGFVVFVSENSNTSKDEAKEIVNVFVREIEYALKTENTHTVTPLGIFKRNPDHCLSFVFDEELNILPQTYGMPVFVLGDAGKKKTFPEATLPVVETVMEPQQQISEPHIEEISVTKAEEEYIEEAIDEPPIQEENKPVHEEIPIAVDSESTNEEEQPLLSEEKSKPEIKPQQPEPLPVQEIEKEKIAQEEPMPVKKKKKKFVFPLIILFVLCAAGAGLYFTGYWEILYNKVLPAKVTQQDSAEQINEVNETTEEQPVEPIAANNEVIPETEIEEEAIPQKGPPAATAGAKYFIVADCFQYPELAEKRVQALQSEGHPAVLAGQTKKGLHIVAYSGFATQEQAEEELKKIKADKNPHAWLYVK